MYTAHQFCGITLQVRPFCLVKKSVDCNNYLYTIHEYIIHIFCQWLLLKIDIFICHCVMKFDWLFSFIMFVICQNASWNWVRLRPTCHIRRVNALVSLLWYRGSQSSKIEKVYIEWKVLEYQHSLGSRWLWSNIQWVCYTDHIALRCEQYSNMHNTSVEYVWM